MKPTWSWQREVTGSVPLLRDYCNKLDMNKIKKLELDITNTVMGLLGIGGLSSTSSSSADQEFPSRSKALCNLGKSDVMRKNQDFDALISELCYGLGGLSSTSSSSADQEFPSRSKALCNLGKSDVMRKNQDFDALISELCYGPLSIPSPWSLHVLAANHLKIIGRMPSRFTARSSKPDLGDKA
ncbi:hypothetical protein F2Q70_00030260 [Brassica cretica]|uniref:Uncharacterized protein n=1 Tax=Brassica cretica TaxID=69181 RepID=A0A8S9FHN2_BRACR|nr:hypothetical protein F2Q70_00030260 [Brassica cretica]